MSYIKRLKIYGFKSFANPTIITFQKHFNSIIGANGAGKSNVFDALCFVLGRMSSKNLRADKLGNLVFNGGKNLKSAKQAEVSIYLNNDKKQLLDSSEDEVKISRIVKNTGSSNYFLNDTKVTRLQIIEVLSRAYIDPDGYNIILQGDIQRIVNMSPIERRILIEDISNVSGYEEQRQKSLKKLELIELDLKDADLLLEEKTKYLSDLKSEKQQAQQYLKVKEDLKYNNLLLIKSKILKNMDLKLKKQVELKNYQINISDFKKELDDFEFKSQEIENEIILIEKEIEIKSHNDFILITNKITNFENEISNLEEKKSELKKIRNETKSRIEGIKIEIVKNKEKQMYFFDELEKLEKNKIIFENDLKKIEEEFQILKKDRNQKNIFFSLEKLEKEIDSLNLEKQELILIRNNYNLNIEKLNNKQENIKEQLKKFEQLSSKNISEKNSLNNLNNQLKKLIISISIKTNKISEFSAKIYSFEKEYSTLVEEYSKLKIKTDSSKEFIMNNKAVNYILKFKQNDKDIFGTVSELVSVPTKYLLAMERISGRSAFNIVVLNENVAIKYINLLRENKIGNVTFLPLTKIKAKYNLDVSILNKSGVIDYAINLIKFDKKYENIFHLIFNNSLIIEKIENVKKIGIGNFRMVTLDGDLIGKSGSMSGGFNLKKSGIGVFKDDKLFNRLEELKRKIELISSDLIFLKKQKIETEKKLFEFNSNKMEMKIEILKLEKILFIEISDTKDLNNQLAEISQDINLIKTNLFKNEEDIKKFEVKYKLLLNNKIEIRNEIKNNSKFSKLDSIEEIRDKLKEKILTIKSNIDSRIIQVKNILKPELKNLEKILKDSNNFIKKNSFEFDNLGEKIKKIDINLEKNKILEKELSKDYKKYIKKRDELKENKKILEKKYEEKLIKFDNLKNIESKIKFSIIEFETLDKTFNEQLQSSYEFVKQEFSNLIDDDIEVSKKIKEFVLEIEKGIKDSNLNIKELQNKVNNLKSQVNSFASINLKAVKIYDRLNEEFSELLEKREILNKEKSEILIFISKMDEKKKIKFIETLNDLKLNFSKFFEILSSKGKAEIILEDEKDIFNNGVEIKVKISKNNYLDIKSLSGGEKSITAIAFIFAVQEFNPANFYIFDEIDAALDIVNVERLGELIKRYSNKTQYIIVSHSEHLIQWADSIYGITMNANKISGVVSLDLENTKNYIDKD